MSTLKLVVVTGNVGPTSKCKLLGDAIAAQIAKRIDVDIVNIELHALIPVFGGVLFRRDLPDIAEAAVRHIETADLLIASTPVYKGSYTGHFKHLFDLVDPNALVGVPVAIAAHGGGERHALVVEHQLRPLFGFFQAQTLPTSVYASDTDFEGLSIVTPGVLSRIEAAAADAFSAAGRTTRRGRNELQAA
jgi:FMN reductase